MTIKATYDPSQTDVDFFCRDATAQWWNGSAYETYNPANLTTYRIAATEIPAGSGLYQAVEPAGTVEFELRFRAGTLAGSYIVAGPATIGGDTDAAAIIAEFKADAQLGTADGGMVANAAEIKTKTDMIGTLRSETRW